MVDGPRDVAPRVDSEGAVAAHTRDADEPLRRSTLASKVRSMCANRAVRWPELSLPCPSGVPGIRNPHIISERTREVAEFVGFTMRSEPESAIAPERAGFVCAPLARLLRTPSPVACDGRGDMTAPSKDLSAAARQCHRALAKWRYPRQRGPSRIYPLPAAPHSPKLPSEPEK
jgi:hypothetical protein